MRIRQTVTCEALLSVTAGVASLPGLEQYSGGLMKTRRDKYLVSMEKGRCSVNNLCKMIIYYAIIIRILFQIDNQ